MFGAHSVLRTELQAVRILVVEDEHKLAGVLKRGLEEEGYAVDVAYDGEEGLALALTTPYDLIVLDVMLPQLDGLNVCHQLRAQNRHMPVLMLTVSHEVRRAGRPIELTSKEYAILEYFARNPNRVLTRTQIAEHVWDFDFVSMSNVIDVYIGYLRRKLSDDSEPRLLRTIRGTGYQFRVPAA